MHPVLEELRKNTGLALQAIEEASVHSSQLLASASKSLDGLDLPATAAVVTLGSLARGEATDGSDLDWFILHDGFAEHEPTKFLGEINRRLESLAMPPPSPAGPFARIANASELVRHIGLEEDTNRNVTQRVVLLLESRPVANDEIHSRVINSVLQRYLEDSPALGATQTGNFVPHFLLNDIVRYWRTICVDYQAKKRLDERKWALRNVKLKHSRKVLFAGALATVLECRGEADVLAFLQERVGEPPLVQLASLIVRHGMFDAGRMIFEVYDQFLGLIGSEEMREHLENLPYSECDTDPRFNVFRETSRRLQEGLELAFFEGPGEVAATAKTYGLF